MADEHAESRPGRAITVVLPTYNRAAALRANLESIFCVEGVDEIIVVDDGSEDDTLEVCAAFTDHRLRVVSHRRNLGVAAARNTGVEAATGVWVLFGEDDCRFPTDYAVVLHSEARRLGADIVGAPLLNVAGSEAEIAEFAANAPRTETVPMDRASTFPVRALDTPFIPATALVRRSVFEQVSFYDGYPVNGYREETDFFVQAMRAGFRCVRTPATFGYQAGFWDGGQHHTSSLRYEYWAIRNHWRFLRRHGHWLVERRFIRTVPGSQFRFTALRAYLLLSGAAAARLRRTRMARMKDAASTCNPRS